MSKSVIIDAVRSPIGLKNGPMIGIRPDDLAGQVVKGLLDRNNSIKPELVEDVIVGCAYPEGPQGHIIGKSVGVLAGLPIESTGKVVNRFCGSSMDAAHQVSTSIESGDIDLGLLVAAVIDPFSINAGFKLLIFSTFGSRGPSSFSTVHSPYLSTGIISFSNFPFSIASKAFLCELIANSSCSSLEILKSLAKFSAVSPIPI